MTAIRPRADEILRRVVARVHRYPEGNDQGTHTHRKSQLAGADRGTFTVTTPRSTWVVPSGWAIWIPSNLAHNIVSSDELALFSLYFELGDVAHLPGHPCIVTIPELLKEMIGHAVRIPDYYDDAGPDSRFMDVLVDQIRELPAAPIELIVPESGPIRAIYETLMNDPLDARSLETWARELHLSRRTLSRLFARTVGVGFKTWKTQLKLLRGLQALSAGESVSNVALDLGYASASAFAAVFRKYLGSAPSRYFQAPVAEDL